ncbi:hypothetical protein [Microbispora sp. CA-102843]|uniref:hypothetical protein n=1 Tax=Microbispora sp. CA-102843 TaxID=3239952 RepID=UPI003D8F4A50
MPEETPQTPAGELRAAATRLREMANGTTPGPWGVADCDLYPRWMLSAGAADGDSLYAAEVAKSYTENGEDGLTVSDPDWAWMAFANPAWAERLAALLERMADVADRAHPGYTLRSVDAALAMARVINGGGRD